MLKVHDTLATETPICITVNGTTHAIMMATPENLENFARGFIYSEGIITYCSEIRDIEIKSIDQPLAKSDLSISTIQIDITLSPRKFNEYKENKHFRRGLTSCGICGSHAMEEAIPELNILPESHLPPASQLIGVHTELETVPGMHSALLMARQGQMHTSATDIGRHNAIDKVLGYAIYKQLDLHECYIISSSRCSVELVQKAVRAGLSTLVHLSSPSDLALKMALFYRLNLIQVLRTGEIKVHTNSQPLSGDL